MPKWSSSLPLFLALVFLISPDRFSVQCRRKLQEIIFKFILRFKKGPVKPIKNEERRLLTSESHGMSKEQRDALKSAQSQMKSLVASDLSRWSIHYIKNGIECYVHHPQDNIPQVLYRGRGLIKGGFTLEETLSVIRSLSARKIWDDKLETGSIVERLSFNESVIRLRRKGMLNVSGREFVTLAAVERFPDEQVIQYVSTSDPTRYSDLTDASLIQAHLYLGGWNLKALEDGSIQVDYIVRVSVGGSIPGALMEFLQLSSLGCIAKIQDFLQSRGPIPFVIHRSHDSQFHDLQCDQEAFDVKTGICDLQISNSGSKETYITVALPRITYPFAQVNVSGLTDSQQTLVRLKSLEDFGHPRDLSSATAWIIQIPIGPWASVSFQIRPSSDSHSLNGRINEASLSEKEDVGSVESPCETFPQAQRILSKIDTVWETSVNGTANYIRSIQYSCRTVCSTVQCSYSSASAYIMPKIRGE